MVALIVTAALALAPPPKPTTIYCQRDWAVIAVTGVGVKPKCPPGWKRQKLLGWRPL